MRRILKKYLSKKVQYALLSYLRVINVVLSNPFRNFRANGFLKFLVDKQKFKKTNELPLSNYPILTDFTDQAGVMSGHYFHQDLVVAQKIFEAQPRRHVDVGSRIDGFVAHVATFRPIEIMDIRVVKSKVPNISFLQGDLIKPSDIRSDSLSCLHTIEHFGLGRYGDPVDPQGHLKGFENLIQMLEKGGTLYISFPISSDERVEFNAHRVFNPLSILGWKASESVSLKDFAYVDDYGDVHKDTSPQVAADEKLIYGCGTYTFEKI